ncbi:P-loop containing nucleoside triphosphate hydrolase protein [Favolaschia claudopus]|uniref:P-loop containing nucleoside triphosphate hydrolase protein n=1 Tax=Favolaschia claudopus TaxID=2862362 RepID=A0AAW0BWV6_9AGAR
MSEPPQSPIPAGKQVVLILVGLIGSGKSTFAQALQEHFPEIRRCNQDDLGDRRAVEHQARLSLQNGSSVCIDRTNFDASQRAHWIRIAREFSGTLVWVLVFDTPKDICASRLQTRTGHPTIASPQDGLEILDRFSSLYRPPSAAEGYDRILYLQPSEQEMVYSPSSLTAILQRVRDASPPVGLPASPPPSTRGSPYLRGASFRWNRGRGRGGRNVNYTGHGGASNSPAQDINSWRTSPGHRTFEAESTSRDAASAPDIRLVGASHLSASTATEGPSNA